MEKRKQVIMDVDTGSDDAVAILLAVLSGKLDIRGITVTGGGNCPLEDCVENTLCVLELLGVQNEIPVYAGCPQAMTKRLTPRRYQAVPDDIHVEVDGVTYSIHPKHFELPRAVTKPQKQHACAYLLEAIGEAAQPLTVIATGPLTNLGMALRMRPQIAKKIEEIVVMGGGVDTGNVTPACEANFFNDPDAAKIVLQCGAPVKVVGLNATMSAQLTADDAETLARIGTPAAKLAAELLRGRLKAGKMLGWGNGISDAVHDALTVASVLDESVLTDVRREQCDIGLGDSLIDGQLVVEHRATGGDFKTRVAYAADKEKFFSMLCAALAK